MYFLTLLKKNLLLKVGKWRLFGKGIKLNSTMYFLEVDLVIGFCRACDLLCQDDFIKVFEAIDKDFFGKIHLS